MELTEMVFVVAILLFIFGPKKLPKLARQLGEAINEFKKASSGIVEAVESPSMSRSTVNRNDAIREIARKLNIKTEGKDIKQITEEIVMRIESKNV